MGTRAIASCIDKPTVGALLAMIIIILSLPLSPGIVLADETQASSPEKIATPVLVRYEVFENSNEKWREIADWSQGKDIPFEVTSTLPQSIASLSELPYWIVINPAKGLAYVDGSATVQLAQKDGTVKDVTKDLDVKYEDGTLYAGSSNIISAIGVISGDDTLTLSYKARLNDRSNIGLAVGNESWAHLEYGELYDIMPSSVATARMPLKSHVMNIASVALRAVKQTTSGAMGDPSLERTVQISTSVYTYKLVAIKISREDKSPLSGATFALRDKGGHWLAEGKQDLADGKWVGDQADATVRTTDARGIVQFELVDADDYELVELEAPKGYALVDPIDVSISSEHSSKEKRAKITARSASGRIAEVDSDAGVVSIEVADSRVSEEDIVPVGARAVVESGLARTADETTGCLPALLTSVLAFLCAVTTRRVGERANTHK